MASEKDSYIFKRRIGQGQFGNVFEVKDTRDKSSYALKIISIQNNDIQKCFKEVEVLAKIKMHPHIVRYYHCWIDQTYPSYLINGIDSKESETSVEFEDDEINTLETAGSKESPISETLDRNYLYIKTELCKMNLRTWMLDYLKSYNQKKPKGVKKILDFFNQVVAGVKFIHKSKYVHRDLKPENIFVTRNGQWQNGKGQWQIKIGDFGIVYQTISGNENDQIRSPNNVYKYGSVPYAAPEMLNGYNFDGRADVYSMAVIFLELLYPMSTLTEVNEVVQLLRNNGQQTQSFNAFQEAHPNEVSRISDMLSEDQNVRPTSKIFYNWLKSHRKTSVCDCICHS